MQPRDLHSVNRGEAFIMKNDIPENPNHELQGLDPGELLARGINTVRPSGNIHHWTPPSPEELASLLPQYQIEEMLGRGGMGAVYKGYQAKLGRSVAIKLLPTELTADEQFVTRFEREARTLARLQHPGIVSIYDFGQTTDGHLYFVMEYVDGTDLQRILQGPGLDPGQALELIGQICEALHAAHCQGVIHRDIKPANILITKDGRVKLADFGLARPDREDHGNITQSNVSLGTPDYMAPEQRHGQTDLRADIYALGVMLYEMLTGQLPRGAWTPPSRKVTVDVRIDEVVIKALQQEPDLRYQQVSEMKTDVDGIRSGVAAENPLPKPSRGWMAWAALVAAIALVAAAVAWTLGTKSNPPAGTPGTAPLPPAASAIPAGAVESPVDGTAGLRRFVFTDPATGLFTRIFLPTKPDSGLLVRMRCAADLMTEEERAAGYDFNTLWEWVQVPPLKNEGENVLILTQGVPVWHRDKTDGDTTVRLVSGIFKAYENEDLFFADQIPFDGVDVTHSPEGIKYTFLRKVGTTNEPFFELEILAVSHQELKSRYPELRGPGETTGEVATWIDDSGAFEKNTPIFNSSVLAGVPGPRKTPERRWQPALSGIEKSLQTTIGRGNSDILYGRFIPSNRDYALVVRWTAAPALLPEWLRNKTGENSVFEWVQFSSKNEENLITIEPVDLANDRNHDNDFLNIRFLGAGGTPFFATEKIPWNDITEITCQTYSDQMVITYHHGTGEKRETWLKVEVLAVAPDDTWEAFPSMYRSDNVAKFYIDGKDASKTEESADTKSSAPYEPPLLASWTGKLLHTRLEKDEYGLTKDIYSTARGSLGLVVRWRFSPALKDDWLKRNHYSPNTTYENVFIHQANGNPISVTLIHGEPVWHEANIDKNGDGGFMIRLLGQIAGPWASGETLLKSENNLRVDAISTGDQDHAVWTFKQSGEDEPLLKVEIMTIPADELAGRETKTNAPEEPQAKSASDDPKLKETEFPEDEYGLKKKVFLSTDENFGLVVRWTAANPAFMGEWEREQGYNEKTVFEFVQLPAKGWENSITLMTGEPLWNRKDREKSGDSTYMVQLRAGHGEYQSPGYAFISADMIPWVGAKSEIRGPERDRAVLEFQRYKDGGPSEGEIWLKAEIQAFAIDEIFAKYPAIEEVYSAEHAIQSTAMLFIDGKPAPDEAY